MDKILIAPGIAMPFFPMRPAMGRSLRTKPVIKEFCARELNANDWVVQPKLNGDRATIGVLDGEVYVQNRHGGWYGHPVKNIDKFLALPSKTVLDGEVFKGKFYPFECLAVSGKSLVNSTAMEREVLACSLTKYVGEEWKFEKPSRSWLAQHEVAATEYEGVVLKRARSPYIIMGTATQFSLDWLKRLW